MSNHQPYSSVVLNQQRRVPLSLRFQELQGHPSEKIEHNNGGIGQEQHCGCLIPLQSQQYSHSAQPDCDSQCNLPNPFIPQLSHSINLLINSRAIKPMHLKAVFALSHSELLKKKKERLFFNSSSNTVSYSCSGKMSQELSKELGVAKMYRVDRVLQVGSQSYSKQHNQIFTKNTLKNLNIFLLGNQEQLKQKCVFSELKHCSVVKELVRRVMDYTRKLYVTIQSEGRVFDKQIISSYPDFIAVLHQSKFQNQKLLRICFEYTIEEVIYTANMVRVPHNFKEASEVFRLKESNSLVVKLCAREKNNLFYLCLDKQSESSEEYLDMMAVLQRQSVLKERNSSSRASSKKLTTESSSSGITKIGKCQRETSKGRDTFMDEEKCKQRELKSEILSRKQNLSQKEEIRSRVSEKILIEKNRKIDQLTKLLESRDVQILQLKSKASLYESQLALCSSEIKQNKLFLQATKSKEASLCQQLQHRLFNESQQSYQRYKDYQDRIQQLKGQVEQLKKLDKITLQKFEQISKQKFSQYGRQIQELKESNKEVFDQKLKCQKEIRALTSQHEERERENTDLKEQLKSKQLELGAVNLKYNQLNSKLKNLLIAD